MASYVTNHGSSARDGRVAVPFYGLVALARVCDPGGTSPRHVLVSPSGERVAVDHGERYAFFTASGVPTHSGEKFALDAITARDDLCLVGGYEVAWDGTHARWLASTGITDGGTQRAFWDDGEMVIAVVTVPGSRYTASLPVLGIRALRFDDPERRERAIHWSAEIREAGCAAVAPDGRVAVALEGGRFTVYDRDGDGSKHALARVDVGLANAPYDLAVIEDGYVLLSAVPRDDGEAWDDGRAESWRRLVAPWTCRSRWLTRVQRLDAAGRETWSVVVPFEVLQPPVDATRGRVYVAGNGFAALEDGEVAWDTGTSQRTHASAFLEGSAAITFGNTLRVVKRDGLIRRTFQVPEGETFGTPPAIASDGAVWAATAQSLYVAY